MNANKLVKALSGGDERLQRAAKDWLQETEEPPSDWAPNWRISQATARRLLDEARSTAWPEPASPSHLADSPQG